MGPVGIGTVLNRDKKKSKPVDGLFIERFGQAVPFRPIRDAPSFHRSRSPPLLPQPRPFLSKLANLIEKRPLPRSVYFHSNRSWSRFLEHSITFEARDLRAPRKNPDVSPLGEGKYTSFDLRFHRERKDEGKKKKKEICNKRAN